MDYYSAPAGLTGQLIAYAHAGPLVPPESRSLHMPTKPN